MADWTPETGYEQAVRFIEEFQANGCTELSLSSLSLDRLPEALGNLTALTKLVVSGNRLQTLPEALGNLTALTELNAFQNQLRTLPEALGNLTALTKLVVSGNQLQTLPEALGNLTALTELEAFRNQLQTLPEALGNLTALTKLVVSGNQLQTLPEALGNLTALTRLDVSRNQLQTLPERIGDLTALHEANFFANPLETPPRKIAEQGIDSIRVWFTEERRIRRRWAWHSSVAGSARGQMSVLAIGELAICAGGMIVAIGRVDLTVPTVTAITLAPFLLMRTNASIEMGLTRFKRLVTWTRLRAGDYARPILRKETSMQVIWRLVRLAGALLTIGIGSLAIKLFTTAQFLFDIRSLAAIPGNYRRQLLVVDAITPAELVPGAEQAYNADKAAVLTVSDLLTNYANDPNSRADAEYDWVRKDPAVSAVGFLTAGVFFLFAWAYRFSLKATFPLYWSFLLVHRYDDDQQIVRTVAEAKPEDWLARCPIAMATLAVGAFALYQIA